jgi:hypothetical protein
MQVGLASFVSKTRSPEGFLHPEWSESFQGWHNPGKSSKAPSCLRQAKLIGIAPKIIRDLSQINPALPASSGGNQQAFNPAGFIPTHPVIQALPRNPQKTGYFRHRFPLADIQQS